MAKDGEVRIGTKLDTEGFKKGVGSLKTSVKSQAAKLSNSLSKFAKKLGKIKIGTKIDTEGFNKGAEALKKSIKNLAAGTTTRLSNVLSKIFKFAKSLSVIALAGTAAFAAFAKSGTDAASDLQEVQNVVDTAFGSMKDKCEDFAKSALETYGLSEYTAKKMASTYMAMGKSMGLSMEQSSDMAISVSKRTADIASFYNLKAEEAAVKLKSIYTGETETLKDLGIVMTEANLKQFALSQGITKSYNEMGQGEKVALRYAFVMNASADAAGDFARTQNSWANQTKILAENFREFKTVIGSYLITALMPVVTVLNAIMNRITAIAKASKGLLSNLFGIDFQESADTAGGIVEDVASGMEDVADATKAADKAQKEHNKSLASFDKLNILSSGKNSKDKSSSKKSSGTDDSAMINKLLSSVKDDTPIKKAKDGIDGLKKSLGKLLEKAEPVTDAMKKLYNEGFKKLAKFESKKLQSFYNKFLKPLGSFALSDEGLPRLFNITNSLLKKIKWNKLIKSMDLLHETLEDMAELTWTALMDFYEEFMVPVGVWTMNQAVPKLVDNLSRLVDKFKKSKSVDNIKQLWKILSKFTTKIGGGLIDFLAGISEAGMDYVLGIDWETFNNVLDSLLNIIANVAINVGAGIINFFKGISPVANWLTNTLLLLLQGLVGAIDDFVSYRPLVVQGGVTGALIGLFTAIMMIKIGNSTVTKITALKDGIQNLITMIKGHPVATAAALIAMLAGAIITMVNANEKSEDQIWYTGFMESLDNLKQKISDTKKAIDDINDSFKSDVNKAEGNYLYVKDLADRYYELDEKVNKTHEDIEKMKTISKIMAEAIGPDSDYGIAIDETTGLIKTQKDELYKNIEAMKKQAIEAAKQSALQKYYEQLIESEVNLAEATNKADEAQKKYDEALKAVSEDSKKYGKDIRNIDEKTSILQSTLKRQKKALDESNKALEDAKDVYGKAESKIKDISSTIEAFDTSNISSEMESAGSDVKDIADKMAADIGDSGKNGVEAFIDHMHNIPDKAEDIGQKTGKNLTKGINSGIGAINVEVDPRFQSPKKKALGGIFSPNGIWRNIPQFAMGMPSGVRGSLFFAGEAGPELVARGRAGSSEILNASQIASAIYSAVVAANKDTGGNGRAVIQIVPDTDNMYKALVKKNDQNIMITNKNPFNK